MASPDPIDGWVTPSTTDEPEQPAATAPESEVEQPASVPYSRGPLDPDRADEVAATVPPPPIDE